MLCKSGHVPPRFPRDRNPRSPQSGWWRVEDGPQEVHPHSRHHLSGFGIRVPGFSFQVSGFGFWDSGFGFPGSGFRVPGFGFRVSGFGFRVPGSGIRVSAFGFPGSGFRVSGFGVPGFGIRDSGFGFRVSGFGVQVSGFGSNSGSVSLRHESKARASSIVPIPFRPATYRGKTNILRKHGYRGTSLIRNRAPLGPYRRTLPSIVQIPFSPATYHTVKYDLFTKSQLASRNEREGLRRGTFKSRLPCNPPSTYGVVARDLSNRPLS